MKSKGIVITIITVIMCIVFMLQTNVVLAEGYTFNFTASPEVVEAKAGDTVTIELGVADIDQSTDGINAIQGDITYDESVFESVEVEATGANWTATFNKQADSNLKGRFVLSNMNSVKTSGTIARIRAKIKANSTATKGYIYIKDVYTSYGTTATSKISRTVTVNITSSSNQGQTTPTGGESNGQPTTQPTAQPTTQATTVNSNNKTASSTAATKTIPKAGITYWLGICLVIAIIEAINRYIKYRKINSDK